MPNQNTGAMHTPSGNLVQVHAQELRTLETTLQRLTQDLQNVQRSATNELIELDNSLAQLSNSVHTLRAVAAEHTTSSRTKDVPQELIRQGQSFTNDVIALARNLTALTQEMRAAVVSFQLDTGDAGLAIEPGNNPFSLPSGSGIQNNFIDSSSRSAPLPPLRENFPSVRPASH